MDMNLINLTDDQVRKFASEKGIVLNIQHNTDDLRFLLNKKIESEKNINKLSTKLQQISLSNNQESAVDPNLLNDLPLEDGVPYYPIIGETINKGVGIKATLVPVFTNINLPPQQTAIDKIRNYNYVYYIMNRNKPAIDSNNIIGDELNSLQKYGTITQQEYQEPMIEYIMTQRSSTLINAIITSLNINTNKITLPELYNLIWYINMGDNNTLGNIRLTKEEINWISSSDTNNLYRIININGKYNGSKEKSALLFAALYGVIIPQHPSPNRYDVISRYSPNIVWILADKVFGIIKNIQNIFAPYIYVSLKELTPMETIMINITPDNIEQLANNYGVAFPSHLNSIDDKINYILNEIARYGPIFDRPQNFPPPPKLLHNPIVELAQYTSKEIINHYWITGDWYDFNSLVSRIKQIVKESPKWSLGHNKNCSNEEANIILGNPSFKENIPDDPVLSYGIFYDYVCYRVSQLIKAWEATRGKQQRNKVIAVVPNWNPDYSKQPGTNFREKMPREFPRISLLQLRTLITPLTGKGYDSLRKLLEEILVLR